MAPRVSVVMPVYRQEAFIGRALGSLLAQTMQDWELVIVDDGSPEPLTAPLAPFAADLRIRVERSEVNRGLGAACNLGLGLALAPLIAYLPADDIVDAGHLEALAAAIAEPGAAMAVTGMRHDGAETLSAPDGFPPQLVQVLHRRTRERWTERPEGESDDLGRLFWHRLRRHGHVAHTRRVTCEWVTHPGQRHRAMLERYDGGLNVFRQRYAVSEPLRFHSSDSGSIDEVALYADLRRRRFRQAGGGLRILLAGELAYNPERVLAFAARGHRLWGTWTTDVLGTSSVGPMPFGHVGEAGPGDPREVIRQVRPHIVYGLLNWRAVPYCHAVLRAARAEGVPFVWHYKESPQRSMMRGEWPLLADLVTRADALVLSSPEEAEWFGLALPGRVDPQRTLVVDGDLPSAHWLSEACAPSGLRERDGDVHTVVVGRPLGFDAQFLRSLAAARIHLHVYGAVRAPGPRGQWRSWASAAGPDTAGFLHFHPPVYQDRWAHVLARYDAGWLHRVPSRNGGDLRRATWDDLNQPARIGPLAIAGIPLLAPRHAGHTVAADRLITDTGIGLLHDNLEELRDQLRNGTGLDMARAAMRAHRAALTFDHHVPRLEALFCSLAGRSPGACG